VQISDISVNIFLNIIYASTQHRARFI